MCMTLPRFFCSCMRTSFLLLCIHTFSHSATFYLHLHTFFSLFFGASARSSHYIRSGTHCRHIITARVGLRPGTTFSTLCVCDVFQAFSKLVHEPVGGNLCQYCCYRGLRVASFLPDTYRLDREEERAEFTRVYSSGELWICKPTGANQVRGLCTS